MRDPAITQAATGKTIDHYFAHFGNQRWEIFFPKMPLSFGFSAKCTHRFLPQRREGGDFTSIFLPFFYQERIIHNFDLSLKFGEIHPAAEALLVKPAKLRLITVMISRAEKGTAGSLAGNTGKISLHWFVQGYLASVILTLHRRKRDGLEVCAIGRNHA